MADDTRRQRNGHTIELDDCMWRCLQCRHWFDAASDADAFWCGDPCTCPRPDAIHAVSPTEGSQP